MAAKKKEIAEVAATDLDLGGIAPGAGGSRLELVSVAAPESGKAAQILEGDATAAAKKLVDLLQREARVL